MKKKRFLSMLLAFLLFFMCSVPMDALASTDVTEDAVPLGRQWITGEDCGEAVVVNPRLRAAVGSSATITPGFKHTYDAWSTHEYTVTTETGTHLGFCAEPNSPTPSGIVFVKFSKIC